MSIYIESLPKELRIELSYYRNMDIVKHLNDGFESVGIDEDNDDFQYMKDMMTRHTENEFGSFLDVEVIKAKLTDTTCKLYHRIPTDKPVSTMKLAQTVTHMLNVKTYVYYTPKMADLMRSVNNRLVEDKCNWLIVYAPIGDKDKYMLINM